jgi:hypothetical protein
LKSAGTLATCFKAQLESAIAGVPHIASSDTMPSKRKRVTLARATTRPADLTKAKLPYRIFRSKLFPYLYRARFTDCRSNFRNRACDRATGPAITALRPLTISSGVRLYFAPATGTGFRSLSKVK